MKVSMIILWILMLMQGLLIAAEYQPITPLRGERPPVDLDGVRVENVAKGKLLIKFRPECEPWLRQVFARSESETGLSTGIAELDALNRLYRVYSATNLLHSKALNPEYTSRHRAWGFHLWYELSFESDADIVGIVKDYRRLDKIIEYAEPRYLFALQQQSSPPDIRWLPNDPRFAEQWHYYNTGANGGTAGADISLPQAWEIEKGHPGVIVAVIDQGIQINHPDIAANMWSGIGWNFVNNNSTIIGMDHGTHVAGTIAAVTNNGIGVSGIAGGDGSTPGVGIMSCQVFTSYAQGGFELAMIYAADNGAAITQNSYGHQQAGVYNQVLLDAIDYFNQYGGGNVMHGGITVFAAGNSNAQGLWYPGCYSGAFSVAATNNQDLKAYYSNYDSWVDISAPGGETDVNSSRGILSTKLGGNYGYFQGTSMACPHVSGVAALVVSQAHRHNLMISSEDLLYILDQTADDHYPQNPNYTGMLGSGRVNAHAALIEVQNLIPGVLNPRSVSAVMAGTDQINISWQRNFHDNPVILAWSADGVFGNPIPGVAYVPGQQIPGGGTIIYSGMDQSLAHTALTENTTYHYMAYSYNAEMTYSSGRGASARTDYIGLALPLNQDFNASELVPEFWKIEDRQGGGQIWSIGRIQTTYPAGLSGTVGNYVFVNSYAYGVGNTQNTDLISPKLNLSNYSSVSLAFTHTFMQNAINSTATLSCSTDNGTTWIPIQIWNASTANPAYFCQSFPSVLGHEAVRFKWNYSGSTAYHWCVDDISITGVLIDPLVPRNLTAVSEVGGINLSWNPPQSGTPDEYKIYRDSQLLYTQAATGTQYLDSSVAYGQIYQYYVTAVYGATESLASNVVTASSVYQVSIIEIGAGTFVQGHPFNVQGGVGYGRCAAVYLQQDIAQSDITLTRLEWYVTRTHSIMIPIKIYLKPFSTNTIPVGSSWANLKTGATLVHDGLVQFDQTGWYGFDIPAYSYGSGNILVLTETNVEGIVPGANYPQFRHTLSAYSTALGGYSTFNSAESSYPVVTPNRPNIRLHYISPPPVLNPPQNLTAVPGDRTVLLSWNAPQIGSSTVLTGYKLYRDNFHVADLPDDTINYTDQNLINNILYRYHITAVYAEGESEASNQAEAIPRPPVLVEPPQDLWIEISNGALVLSWSLDPEIDYYRVEASDMCDEGFVDITSDGDFYQEVDRIWWYGILRPEIHVNFFRVFAHVIVLE